MKNLLFFLCSICFLAIACQKDNSMEEQAQNLRPGLDFSVQRVENIITGESRISDVFEAFGTIEGSKIELWDSVAYIFQYDHLGLVFATEIKSSDDYSDFDPNQLLYHVLIKASYEGITEKGIGIGSTKEEVRQAYGSPTEHSQVFNKDSYRSMQTFIEYNDEDQIESIEYRLQ